MDLQAINDFAVLLLDESSLENKTKSGLVYVEDKTNKLLTGKVVSCKGSFYRGETKVRSPVRNEDRVLFSPNSIVRHGKHAIIRVTDIYAKVE